MIKFLIFLAFFIQINFTSYSQFGSEFNKFTIKPVLGLGRNIREQPTKISGNDWMTASNKSRVVSSLYNSFGEERFEYRVSNNFGIEADYGLDKNNYLGVSLLRSSQVFNDLSAPTWVNSNNKLEQWYGVVNYKTAGFHAKRVFWSYDSYKFIQVGASYTFDVKNPFDANGDGNFIKNNQGLLLGTVDYNIHSFVFNAEVGIARKNGNLIPIEHEVILGFTLPTDYLSNNSYKYFKNNILIGENQIKQSQRALWLQIGFPVAMIRNKITIDKKPKPPKEISYEGKKIRKGENIVLEKINFGQTSSDLPFSSMQELNKLVDLMQKYDNISIIISGHTSDEGDRKANIELSKRRAEACKSYLKNQGIKSKRIETKGLGPDFPISQSNKVINRRVEFKIIED